MVTYCYRNLCEGLDPIAQQRNTVTASMQDIEHLSTNRLSVVVPVFNEEDAVSDCIERLLTQPEIDEILIVDNNSTDGTASIIQEFARKYDKVRYVFEARQGVVHARNAGFDASTGNIIGRIDADTRVQPGWASAVKAFFQRSTAHSAVAGLTYLFESPFARIHRYALDRQVKQGSSIANVKYSLSPERTWRSERAHGCPSASKSVTGRTFTKISTFHCAFGRVE